MSEHLTEKLFKFWQNKFPNKVNTPEDAIKTAIYSKFPDLNKVEPPIKIEYLEELAEKMGVKVIRRLDMQPSGLISLLKTGEYKIDLNEKDSIERQRFTLAHEIGHTFFFKFDDEINDRARSLFENKNLETPITDQPEERLCDIAAAEILMPSQVFQKKLSAVGHSAKSILRLSNQFKTSIQATSRRLAEISPYKLVIALWEFQPNLNAYKTVWVARRAGNHLTKEFIVDESVPIFRTFQEKESFRGREFVRLGGPSFDEYCGDGLVLNGIKSRRILTVFILERYAQLAYMWEKYGKNLYLNLELRGVDDPALNQITEIVEQNPGKYNLYINLNSHNEVPYIIKSKTMRVNAAPEVIMNLRSILGQKNVWIEG